MEQYWEIVHQFRFWVCSELRNLNSSELLALRGDYLFIIDQFPRFIVMVNDQGAWSVTLSSDSIIDFQVEEGCPFSISTHDVSACIESHARAVVRTNSNTLQKLLLGRMKAKIAFLTNQVSISGDLKAFLKMVSLLKQHGVKPLSSSSVAYDI